MATNIIASSLAKKIKCSTVDANRAYFNGRSRENECNKQSLYLGETHTL